MNVAQVAGHDMIDYASLDSTGRVMFGHTNVFGVGWPREKTLSNKENCIVSLLTS